MQKILELNDREWLTGVTEDINSSNSPFLSPNTNGVSAIDFDAQREKFGVLSVGCKPWQYNVTNTLRSTQDDIEALAYMEEAIGSQVLLRWYLYDKSGNLYYIQPTIQNGLKDVRNTNPLTDTASGLGSFTMKAGTKYLFYAREGHIGRYDLSTDTASDAWQTLSTSTTQRPMFKFQDRIYFGNGNKIGMIYEEGGVMKLIEDALDLPVNENVIDFAGLDKYLVIATDSGEIFFWDTNTDSWQRRHLIHRMFEGCFSIHSVSGLIVALTKTGLWQLNFSTPPSPLFEFSSRSNIRPKLQAGANQGYKTRYGQSLSSSHRDEIAWTTENEGIAVYSLTNKTLNIVHAGLPVGDETTSLLVGYVDGVITVSIHGDGDLWTFYNDHYTTDPGDLSDEEDARQAQSGVTQAETRIIDMEDTHQVTMIEVLLDQAPQTHTNYENDKLVVKARGNTNDAYTTYGTINTTGELKKTFQLRPTKTFTDDTIQIKLEYEGGNPLVRSVGIYGDKIAR